MENYLTHLNEQQRAAVVYTDGPQLIVAGAGSGKTRVLTYKIVHLLHLGYKPHEILALTFTNKAAREMRERITKLVGIEVASKLWVGTFHSIFAKLLRLNADKIGYKSNYTIYDATDSVSVIKHIVKDMELDDKVYKASAIQDRISMCKNALISPNDYVRKRELRLVDDDVQSGKPLICEIYKKYWERCQAAGAMDFDDLLYNTNVLLRDFPDVKQKYQEFFKYILIDEYQDTNFAQDMIVYQLGHVHQHISAVGDDAQSIYSFRGANINNILGLQKKYPALKIFRLEQNYRSTQNITLAANSLIDKNKGQIKKSLFSENAEGTKIKVIQCSVDYEEAYVVANRISQLKRSQGSSWSDFAVLYRTNAQSRILEKALRSGGLRDSHGNTRVSIPYRIYGGLSFYQRKEVKDAVCYMRMVLNPDDEEALRRIINYPARGIGDTTVKKISDKAVQHGVSMWQVISAPGRYELNVNKGTLAKLDKFGQLMKGLIQFNQDGVNAYETVREIIEKAQLLSVLISDKTPENISRQENLQELLNSAKEFVENQQELGDGDEISLSDYMAEVSLATDQDKNADENDVVTLMTVHAAKGLEYRNVVIFGVEEDFFPSLKSKNSLPEIEEERRLLYVAITRAEENCIITYANQHFINGNNTPCSKSRFIADINPAYLSSSSTSYDSEPQPKSSSRNDRWINPHVNDAPVAKVSINPTQPPRKFVPISSANPVKPKLTPSSGKISKHSASELKVGMQINHGRFGYGTIKSIDTSSDEKIIVAFNTLGVKTLLLKFANFEIL